MATGKRFYWIKLKDTFMSSDTVDYLMGQKDGANYVVLYQMLCLKTINTEGRLARQIGEIIIPYDIEKIQRDCKWFTADTIRVAFGLYRALGLIYEDVDGVLVLSDHSNLVGSETDYAAQKKMQRQNATKLPPSVVDNGVDNVHTEKEIRDKDKEIRDKDIKSLDVDRTDTTSPQAEAVNCPFARIRELYNTICISYPKIKAIDGSRKRATAARWRTYKSLSTFEELFKIAENSSFLKGNNDRNWSADFDWMMKPTNFSKILEHRYDDKVGTGSTRATNPLGTLQRMFEEAQE